MATKDFIGWLIKYFSKRLINYDTIERITFVIYYKRGLNKVQQSKWTAQQLTVNSERNGFMNVHYYTAVSALRGGGHASPQTPPYKALRRSPDTAFPLMSTKRRLLIWWTKHPLQQRRRCRRVAR